MWLCPYVAWCYENYVSRRSLESAQKILNQLVNLYINMGLQLQSCGPNLDAVRRCLVTGFFLHSAR
jgi:hypothetical protein